MDRQRVFKAIVAYLSRSDLIKFIEETMIASPNQREIELSSNGLKVASHAG